MADILLCTFNARYNHSALGLRYLAANLGDLRPRAEILEYTLAADVREVADALIQRSPKIIGLGVYIWNREISHALVGLLKRIAPDITLVLGGPEVSYEFEQDPLVALADHVITGWGDLAFAELCQSLLNPSPVPPAKIMLGGTPKLADIQLPYAEYSAQDIQHRFIYVEASRGCPFRCQFCLSALDKTAWPFEIERFLQAMQNLYDRGARHFKFVDRTFNLKIEHCEAILGFFLARISEDLFLHFELIPDSLPERLRPLIQQFPAGSLQFEIGVQSWTPEVQANITRRQNNQKTEAHLRWLREHSQAHLHTDLIFALPGETLESFAAGFDRLYRLKPQEIQLGILKRLKGAPIIQYEQRGELCFEPSPPYRVLRTAQLDYHTIQRVDRAARYWDAIANSGRFKHCMPLLFADAPFDRLLQLSDFLYAEWGQSHSIGLPRLFRALAKAMREVFALPEDAIEQALRRDHAEGQFKFQWQSAFSDKTGHNAGNRLRQRQQQHLSAS